MNISTMAKATSHAIGFVFRGATMNVRQIKSGIITHYQHGYNDAARGYDFKAPGFSQKTDAEYLDGYTAGAASIEEFGQLDDDAEPYLYQ
jgi:hypothetical protein